MNHVQRQMKLKIMQQLLYTCRSGPVKSFVDGNYSEKNLVGMDTARGSLTLFERFLVFRVGQVNEKEIEKSKRN